MLDALDSNTWWGTQIHCGEPNPYMVGRAHTWWHGLLVSSIVINQALRTEMKTSEQTHARAVRKLPIDSWEQGPGGNKGQRKRVMRKVFVSHRVDVLCFEGNLLDHSIYNMFS